MAAVVLDNLPGDVDADAETGRKMLLIAYLVKALKNFLLDLLSHPLALSLFIQNRTVSPPYQINQAGAPVSRTGRENPERFAGRVPGYYEYVVWQKVSILLPPHPLQVGKQTVCVPQARARLTCA